MALDPITLEVINNRLREIVSTMERLLFHSGYSTILRESHDGSACLADRDGGVVMGSGLPIHLFPYFYIIRAILKEYPPDEMRDGDSYIITDPYLGGNLHVPDLGVVTPIFAGGELLGFAASIAHKPDVGGLVPGSSSANAREIYHDGLLLPPVRYWTRDGVVKEVDAILRRNSRMPDVVAGDVRAQVGCTKVGATKLQELCREYGTDSIEVHRDAIQPGERVVVVDDLLATGGTLGACVSLMRKLGGHVVTSLVVVELTFLNGRQRIADQEVFALLQY